MFKKVLVLFVIFTSLLLTIGNGSSLSQTETAIRLKSNSRALMASKMEPWQGFMEGDSGCISVVKNGVICGWTAVSAGFKCAWSYIKCIIPKCKKCCAKGWFKWLCAPCKCSWNCNSKKCKEEFKKVGKSCKIAADDCVNAFKHLGKATKKFFEDVADGIKFIANKIAHAAKWVAEKAWAAVKWVWDKIKALIDLIKIFEVAKAIGDAFSCFGKLGSRSQIEDASKNAGNVKNVAESQGKNGIISKIDGLIPGFKAFVCCLQSTAIGKVLNKWGKKLLDFHKNWHGLKVGSFINDPAIVVSLAASAFNGFSVGTSLDIGFSTAFNVGLYWTVCTGFVTDVGVGVSIVVNLFRKWSMVPGQSIAISFSVGIPDTPIGVGAGVVLPIGGSSVDFGAVNVEVGASNGVSPVSVGGHVCNTVELVSFNLLELIGNILTANNECPSKLPVNTGSSSSSTGSSSTTSGQTKEIKATGSLKSSKNSGAYWAWSGFETTITGFVSKLNVHYKWKDQGWGNRQGHIKLYAYSGSNHIATLNIASGVAPHSWATVNKNVASSELGSLGSGIVLKLMYKVGGGGGHVIYVNDFKATITYSVPFDKTVKASGNLHSTKKSDSFYVWSGFQVTLAGRVSGINVQYKWKDQGWGGAKGKIYLYAYNGSNKIATLGISSSNAPHSWATVNMDVPDNDLKNLVKGIVLKLYYRVGGGGGHQLYLNDFKATLHYTGVELMAPLALKAMRRRRVLSKNNRRSIILQSHKVKMFENNEMKIRQQLSNARRLQEEEEEEERNAMQANSDNETPTNIQGTPLPVIDDPCDPSNTSGEEALLKEKGFDKMTIVEIAHKYCTKQCQSPATQTEADDCTDYRGAICMKGGFGSTLDSITKCCKKMFTDAENLWFNVRKFCAQHALVTTPTRKQFCDAASKNADQIQKDFNIINTIMDGCAANFEPTGCRKLKGQQTAVDLAKVANQLCKNNKFQDFIGETAKVGATFWIFASIFGIVGILKMKYDTNNKNVNDMTGYESLI